MPLRFEERILIARAVKRDPEAFSALYVQFYYPVLRRVTTITRSRHDAEDVANEAFLRAWNAIERFQDRDVSILAWLCTIAERLAVKQVRSRRPSIAMDDDFFGAPSETYPDAIVQRNAEVATLQSALKELPTVQREVVLKRYLEGTSYKELALALGKPVGTIRVIQHRALRALRCILLAKDMGWPRPTLPNE